MTRVKARNVDQTVNQELCLLASPPVRCVIQIRTGASDSSVPLLLLSPLTSGPKDTLPFGLFLVVNHASDLEGLIFIPVLGIQKVFATVYSQHYLKYF